MNAFLLLLSKHARFVWENRRGANTCTMDEIAFTTAHEIGHLLLGPGHPDEGGGEAPFQSLQLDDHQKRLMCSGPNYILGTSRLLVKAEWDKAEDWLKRVIDGIVEE